MRNSQKLISFGKKKIKTGLYEQDLATFISGDFDFQNIIYYITAESPLALQEGTLWICSDDKYHGMILLG